MRIRNTAYTDERKIWSWEGAEGIGARPKTWASYNLFTQKKCCGSVSGALLTPGFGPGKSFFPDPGSNPWRYRPARLDLHESGIIEKPFKRTSTAICFQFFIFDLEFLKQLQSSEPLHAKRPLIFLLVRFTVCMRSSRDLFRQTVFHKCERGINCSLDCGSQVKKFIIPQPDPK